MPQPSSNPFAIVQHGELQSLRALASSLDLVSQREPVHGHTLLHTAVTASQLDCLRLLLSLPSAAPAINVRDNDNQTPLYLASALGVQPAVEALVRAGADVEMPNHDGTTPLLIACFSGHASIAAMLLDTRRANLMTRNASEQTAMSLAASEGHVPIVELLLARGFPPNYVDQFGWTPLMLASHANKANIVTALVNAGADPSMTSPDGKTAMAIAHAASANDAMAVLAHHRAQSIPANSPGGLQRSATLPTLNTAPPNATGTGPRSGPQAMRFNSLPHTAKQPLDGSQPHQQQQQHQQQHQQRQPSPPSGPPTRNNSSDSLSRAALLTSKPALAVDTSAMPSRQRSGTGSSTESSPTLGRSPSSAQPMLHQQQHHHHQFARHLGASSSSAGSSSVSLNASTDDLMSVLVPLNDLSSSSASVVSPAAQASRQAQQYVPLNADPAMRRRHLNRRSTAKLTTDPLAQAQLAEALAGHVDHRGNIKESVRSAPSKGWQRFSRVVSCWAPDFMLERSGLHTPQVREAWREKIGLCFLILMCSSVVGFLTFGMSAAVCKPLGVTYRDFALSANETDVGNQMSIVRGRLYRTGEMWQFGHHKIALERHPALKEEQRREIDTAVKGYLNKDITALFPLPQEVHGCPVAPESGDCAFALPDACHTTHKAHEMLERFYTGRSVAWSWDNITDTTHNKLFVFSHRVYSLTRYFEKDSDQFLAKLNVTKADLAEFVGMDATLTIDRSPKLRKAIPCFEYYFRVGQLEGTSVECLTSNTVTLIISVVLLGLIAIKFISAVAFNWALSRRLGRLDQSAPPKPWVICLVTAYSEDRAGIQTTLDSLSATDYPSHQKLLVVIADGNVTGAGQSVSTPDICRGMLKPARWMPSQVEPASYVAIGDGNNRHNMAEVHAGHYVYKDKKVPMVLINKVGNSEERGRPKAGNRGKRDSQIILMSWLNKLAFNDRMCPLEFDLSDKVYRLTGEFPTVYEMVLMVDADTLVLPDSLGRMVAAFEDDDKVMGLCGETRIANKRKSWVTMIQVFEYYISHHLGKAFESIFGGVTCLPGCFCMYRIRAPKAGPDGEKGKFFVPVLANPAIVEAYSQNEVNTLHEKNLLLLGEDRYLTTLMLRTFPKRKMIFVPRAVCKTEVPDRFSVLLSQRRRWINSTVHNLYRLLWTKDLCGIFCCSMPFVIGLELIASVSLPAMLLFLLYLIVRASMGDPNAILPLVLMAAMFLLQAVLILITTRKVIYIWWMFVYIFAIPVWNFILPVYAFWHFDDFSWGATRKIEGVDNGHGSADGRQVFDPLAIPRKYYQEWKDERSRYARKMREANMPPPPMPSNNPYRGQQGRSGPQVQFEDAGSPMGTPPPPFTAQGHVPPPMMMPPQPHHQQVPQYQQQPFHGQQQQQHQAFHHQPPPPPAGHQGAPTPAQFVQHGSNSRGPSPPQYK